MSFAGVGLIEIHSSLNLNYSVVISYAALLKRFTSNLISISNHHYDIYKFRSLKVTNVGPHYADIHLAGRLLGNPEPFRRGSPFIAATPRWWSCL